MSGRIHPYLAAVGTPLNLRLATVVQLRAYQKRLMLEVVNDRVNHAEALAAGAFKWRLAISRDLSAFWHNNRAGCDDFADGMFRFFQHYWRQQYLTEGMPQFDGLTPQRFLNAVHVPSPLSDAQREAEIDDAWEVEIGSSQDAMESMYEGSCRTRKGRDLGERKTRVN